MLVVPNAQHEPQYLQRSNTDEDVGFSASDSAMRPHLLGNVLISELCEIVDTINVSPEPCFGQLAYWNSLVWPWADDLFPWRQDLFRRRLLRQLSRISQKTSHLQGNLTQAGGTFQIGQQRSATTKKQFG